MRIAIRFVPFARELLSPRNIRVGKVIVDPPPAITLIKPATEPTKKRRISFDNSSIVYSFTVFMGKDILPCRD